MTEKNWICTGDQGCHCPRHSKYHTGIFYSGWVGPIKPKENKNGSKEASRSSEGFQK